MWRLVGTHRFRWGQQRGLLCQGEVEEPGLVSSGADHIPYSKMQKRRILLSGTREAGRDTHASDMSRPRVNCSTRSRN